MKLSALPYLCAVAFAALLLTSTASAQGVTTDNISTKVNVDAVDIPVTFTYVYQYGRTQTTYYANGSYSEAGARGLGNLLSVEVFGTSTAYGVIDNETTPGTGRKVLVSFTSRVEANGSTTTIIVSDNVVM